MALSFVKKANPASSPPPENPASTSKPFGSKAFGTKSSPPSEKPAPKASGGMGFMKKGKEAQAAVNQADAKAQKAKDEANKLWRYWMPADTERQITFLDGELGEDGMLDIPMWYEHRVKVNGKWENFVCVAETEPCPICEAGESKQTLVGCLTCIDHSEHKVQSGPNAGKIIKNSRKLFVMTRNTLALLSKKAAKQGGLTGVTFDVSRTTDKEPSVGSSFDFVEKNSLSAIAKKCGLKAEEVEPANYEEEVTYRTADELVELGLGKPMKGPGYEKPVNGKNLKSEL